jgi:hypothetical protein
VICVFFFGAGLVSCAAEVHIFQAVFHAVVLLSPERRGAGGAYYFYTGMLTEGLVPRSKSVLEFSRRNFHDAPRYATSRKVASWLRPLFP